MFTVDFIPAAITSVSSSVVLHSSFRLFLTMVSQSRYKILLTFSGKNFDMTRLVKKMRLLTFVSVLGNISSISPINLIDIDASNLFAKA